MLHLKKTTKLKALTIPADFSLQQILISMQHKNVIFPKSVGFSCRNCGVCCRDQPPDINFKEQLRIETAGYRDFMLDPSDPNNRNIRKNKDGSCFFFSENACKINPIKPSICLLEPFIIVDFDVDKNEIILDLNPLAIQNCKGLCTGENVAEAEIGKAAQTIVKDLSEIIAEKTGLLVTDKKVAALTKKLLKEINSM